MEGQSQPDRPRWSAEHKVLIGVMIVLPILWAAGGLWPALWALENTRLHPPDPGKPFDWNARLGTFGDSFAGVGSLIATLGLLAVAYQLLRDREQRKEQAEIAFLSALIQGRIARDQGYRDFIQWATESRARTRQTGVVSPSDETVDSANRASEHNHVELERLIKRAEAMMNWSSSPLPPSNIGSAGDTLNPTR